MNERKSMFQLCSFDTKFCDPRKLLGFTGVARKMIFKKFKVTFVFVHDFDS